MPRTMDAAAAGKLLDGIASEEQDLARIGSAFRERASEPENPVVRAAVWALGYWLIESSNQSARDSYGPLFELQGRVFPPYLGDVRERDDTVAAWRELAGLVRSPAIKARLSDLLWCTDQGQGRHQHARNAVEGYLAVALSTAGGWGQWRGAPESGNRLGQGVGTVTRDQRRRACRTSPRLRGRACCGASWRTRARVPGRASGCVC